MSSILTNFFLRELLKSRCRRKIKTQMTKTSDCKKKSAKTLLVKITKQDDYFSANVTFSAEQSGCKWLNVVGKLSVLLVEGEAVAELSMALLIERKFYARRSRFFSPDQPRLGAFREVGLSEQFFFLKAPDFQEWSIIALQYFRMTSIVSLCCI